MYPTKIEEDSVSILSGADEDYEFGASIDSSNLFEDENVIKKQNFCIM